MMNNLLTFASVAKKTTQLLSSVVRIRFLLAMFLMLCVSTNVWGATVTFTAGTDKGSTQNTSADSMTKDGITISSTSAGLAYAQYRFYNGTITIKSTVGNITGIVFTCTSNDYASALAGTPSAGSLSKSGSTVTWTGSSSEFTIKNTSQSRVSKIVVTTASSYTVNWTINPAESGTLSASTGASTTVTPNDAYTYASPAYTVNPSSAASVSQSENTFTATPSANCTIQINMVEKTPATISFENMGAPAPITTGYYVGDTYTLPDENDFTCGDKTFVGWSTVAIANADTKPTADTYYEPGESVTLEADNTFYAVFATSSGGAESTITLTASDFGLTTTYAVKTATIDGYSFTIDKGYLNNKVNIQMNSSQGNGILYNTTPIMGLSAITLNVASGSNTKTLYSGTTQKPTTQVGTTTSTETFSIPAGNTYFKIGVSGANYFSSIVITYSTTSYSDYTTSCTTETVVCMCQNSHKIGIEQTTYLSL